MPCIYCGKELTTNDPPGWCAGCAPVPTRLPEITLRDFFAGCALVGMLAFKGEYADARDVYSQADMMLKERDK